MQTVYFPNLGWSFDLNPTAFTIGNFTFRWYGILIAIGFLLAVIYAFKRIKEFGIDADRAIDVILAGTIGAVVGARLYYVIFQWSEFADNPISILHIWNGGLAIYGGLIGAFLFGGLFCKIRKVKLLPMFDLVCSGMLLGQGIGRWGNFVNVEAFGSNTTLPWGMTSAGIKTYLAEHETSLEALGVNIDPALPVHPTFLYESIWCILGFVLIALYIKRRRFDGEITLMYTGWYGLGRMFIEGLRTDSLMIGSLRVSQILAALLFIAALITWFIIHNRIKNNHDDEYLKLYVLTDEGKEVVAGTYYERLKEEKLAAKAAKEAEKLGFVEDSEEEDEDQESEECECDGECCCEAEEAECECTCEECACEEEAPAEEACEEAEAEEESEEDAE